MDIEKLIQDFNLSAEDSSSLIRGLLTAITEGKAPGKNDVKALYDAVEVLRNKYDLICGAVSKELPSEELPEAGSSVFAFKKAYEERETILVVCPNVLCRKWQNELSEKFQMNDFQVLDSGMLKYYLTRIQDGSKNLLFHGIVSEQLIRGEAYWNLLHECLDAVGEPFIQMLIIDECHHYRNSGTKTNRVGQLLSMCAERVVMLSATPYNLRSNDLFNQLHLLNPFLFPDEKVFNELAKQIRNVNQCISLLRDRNEESDIELMNILDELQPLISHNQSISKDFDELRKFISDGKALDIKQVVKYENTLNLLNPIASSFTRTLKRDLLS